jgi:cell shape-determining protein MreD
MLFNAVVFILLLLSFGLQEFVPSVPIAHHARLFLPAVFFFSSAVATSFPMMLFLAFVTGILWDARYLPAPMASPEEALALMEGVEGQFTGMGNGELVFGLSILFFGLFGALMQGVRPLFKRGRLELPVLMIGFAVFGWLFTQFLMITFIRGSFSFPPGVWSKMLVAPILFLVLHALARWMRYEIRYDGLRQQYHGR